MLRLQCFFVLSGSSHSAVLKEYYGSQGSGFIWKALEIQKLKPAWAGL